MEKSLPNKKFSHFEMQELIPDYVFGKISSSDREIFERTLPDYEDLQNEIEEIRSAFNKVEEIDPASRIEQRAKNISVKVQQRLEYEKDLKLPGFAKLFAPVLTVAAVVYILFFMEFGTDNKDIAVLDEPVEEFILINESEALSLIEDSVSSENIAEVSGSLETDLNEDMSMAGFVDLDDLIEIEVDSLYKEYVLDFIADIDWDDLGELINSNFFPETLSEEDFEMIEEDELINILKAIENEDIST